MFESVYTCDMLRGVHRDEYVCTPFAYVVETEQSNRIVVPVSDMDILRKNVCVSITSNTQYASPVWFKR